MTLELTGRDTDVLNALVEIAAEHPDTVYTAPDDNGKCVYTWFGKPSCIIGHALARSGVPLTRIAYFDGPVDDFEAGQSACSVAEELGLTDRTARVLEAVQTAQDTGTPWAAAVAPAAKELAKASAL